MCNFELCFPQHIYPVVGLLGDMLFWDFPDGSDGKESTCNTENHPIGEDDPMEKSLATHSSFLAWQRSKDRGAMDRGAWKAMVHSCKELDTIEKLTQNVVGLFLAAFFFFFLRNPYCFP